MTQDLAASIRARLLNLAKAERSDFNNILVRYTLERLLYRLSISPHADSFLLTGALLFTLWYALPHRPTRDADLLGFGPSDLASLCNTFRDIAAIPVDDGLVFNADTVAAKEIRKNAGYAGARVTITAELARARCKAQIDIGFGDAVTPGPVDAVFPVMIGGLPAPQLRAYPVYTVIAEKLHAIVVLGATNTRLKDYLDLSVLLSRENLDAGVLASALEATFHRRSTALPDSVPVGLTDTFANDPLRQGLWTRYLAKNGMPPRALQVVVNELRMAFLPAFAEASTINPALKQ
jgi:hypothetical protein